MQPENNIPIPEDISTTGIAVKQIMPYLELKKMFKGWFKVNKYQQNIKEMSLMMIESRTQFLSQYDFCGNVLVDELAKFQIMTKEVAENIFDNWQSFIQLNKSIMRHLNEIAVEAHPIDSPLIKNFVDFMLHNSEYLKQYRQPYRKVSQVLANMQFFNQLKQKNDPFVTKYIKIFLNSILIPLRQISQLKNLYQKFCLSLIAMKMPYKDLIWESLFQFLKHLQTIPLEINNEGWENSQLKMLKNLFPHQIDTLATKKSHVPIFSSFDVIINFEQCKAYLLNDYIFLLKKNKGKIWNNNNPSFLHLSSNSYTKVYPDSQGIFFKNTVLVCGSNYCYHFSFDDRVLMHFFHDLVEFRIKICPKVTEIDKQVNPYFEEIYDSNIQVSVLGVFYRLNQLWYQIQIKMPTSNYLPDLPLTQFPTINNIYLKLDKIMALKQYICSVKPKQSSLIKNLLIQTKILSQEEAKQFQCLHINQFLLIILRAQQFHCLQSNIYLKLGLSEGFYQMMKKCSFQGNYSKFCTCFDCKYRDERPHTYIQVSFEQMKYQPHVSQRGIKHFISRNKKACGYCPIYLKNLTNSYAASLNKKYNTSNASVLNSILNRENLLGVKEKISMAYYNAQIQNERIFYTLSQKTALPTLYVHYFDLQDGVTASKVIGLCKDSTIWHLKYLLGKRLGVRDLFLEGFVISIFEKIPKKKNKKNKKQSEEENYEQIFILKNEEYLYQVLTYLNKNKNACLFLRKWIKIPFEEYQFSKNQELLSFSYRQLELEAAQMLYQLNSGWLKEYIQGDQNSFYKNFIKSCYFVWVSRFSKISELPPSLEFSQLKKIPLLREKNFLNYYWSQCSEQIDTFSHESKHISVSNKSEEQKNYELIGQIIEQTKEMREDEREESLQRVQIMKKMIFIIDENSDWNLQIFDVLICQAHRFLQKHELDFSDESMFYKSKIRVNYYGIILKIKTGSNQQLLKLTYKLLKVIVFGSILRIYSPQTKDLIVYSSQPHHLYELIRFYQQFYTQIKNDYSSVSLVKQMLSVSQSFSIRKKEKQFESSIIADIQFEQEHGKVPKGQLKI